MSELKRKTTARGFVRYEFADDDGDGCSIQESSIVGNDDGPRIWFGVNDAWPMFFVPNEGWQEVQRPDLEKLPPNSHILTSGRMHLSQRSVEELIPILQFFVDHGYLNGQEAEET